MPLHMMGDVPFSTLKEKTHKGPRTAGNKSALSYRADLGIPGYTGYIPSTETVPLDPKGCCLHTGRLPGEADKNSKLVEGATEGAASEYHGTFKAARSSYHVPTKTGGGYWFQERSHAAAQSSQPFLGTSSYRAELESGDKTARAQLGRSEGLNCNLVAYETALQGRARSAGAALSRTTQQLSGGDLVGYTTSYGRMTAPHRGAASDVVVQELSSSRRRPPHDGPPEVRHQVMPSTSCTPRLGQQTAYRQEYGRLGTDPQSRMSPDAQHMTLSATTSDLAQGTARASLQVPGYGGHVPAAPPPGTAPSGGYSRPDHKSESLLFALDQYSRNRLPKYTGFKAQDPSNVDTSKFNEPEPSRTVQGISQKIAADLAPSIPNGKSHGIDSGAGLMSFFTSGGPVVSDNGLFDAQLFYMKVAPLEGRLRKGPVKSSETTHYGAKFKSTNSLV